LKFLAVVRFVSRRGQVMAAAAAQQPLQQLLQQLISRREFASSTAASKRQLELEVTAGKGKAGSAFVVIG
jgi:hypothetical protein